MTVVAVVKNIGGVVMMTIKFETRTEESMIKEYNRETPRCAVEIGLLEALNPWHREYTVRSMEEWQKWCDRYLSGSSHFHLPGTSPETVFSQVPKDEDPPIVYFQFLTFKDMEGNFHRAVIHQATCYIMNESGQTVDRFAA